MSRSVKRRFGCSVMVYKISFIIPMLLPMLKAVCELTSYSSIQARSWLCCRRKALRHAKAVVETGLLPVLTCPTCLTEPSLTSVKLKRTCLFTSKAETDLALRGGAENCSDSESAGVHSDRPLRMKIKQSIKKGLPVQRTTSQQPPPVSCRWATS